MISKEILYEISYEISYVVVVLMFPWKSDDDDINKDGILVTFNGFIEKGSLFLKINKIE